jgi:MOSC domain-containing protein YiiM
MKDTVTKQTIEAKVKALFFITDGDEIISIDKLTVSWDGIVRDKHTSRTSLARTQDASENGVQKGMEILNLRQFTIISHEELKLTAEKMGIEKINEEDLHPNIVLEGLPNLTQLPFGVRMHFPQFASLLTTGENFPCIVSGNRIQKSNIEIKGLNTAYPKAGMHLRGITAMVLKPGFIRVGDIVKIMIPSQSVYKI